MTKRKTYTAADLVALIRNRYDDARRYVVMTEVANGTGSTYSSRIDAVVISLWPSDGLTRRALEIKVSRSDFLRELAEPAKNRWAHNRFHEFWFVAPTGVIKEAELPEGAGWLRPHGDTLAVVRAAARREHPELGDALFAALCRSLVDEQDRKRTRIRRDIIAQDPVFTRAMAWERAGKALIRERHGWAPHGADVKEILESLHTATQDKQLTEERDQVVRALAEFQHRLVDLFDVFCVLAHVGLLERDAAGEALATAYRIKDAASLAVQRAEAKSRSAFDKAESLAVVRCRDFLTRRMTALPDDTMAAGDITP